VIEKLRSHLRKAKGFTLIELLIVIAIIAILVVIVIIAINPVERLNSARDRTAASNVRATGTLIATCITQALTLTAGSVADCDTETEIETVADGNVPDDPAPGVTILPDALPATTDVCAWQLGRTGRWYMFENDGTGGGTTTEFAAQPTATDCLN
jgi:prepilin-type N-terminal cleavage/methylation domain-containing protein